MQKNKKSVNSLRFDVEGIVINLEKDKIDENLTLLVSSTKSSSQKRYSEILYNAQVADLLNMAKLREKLDLYIDLLDLDIAVDEKLDEKQILEIKLDEYKKKINILKEQKQFVFGKKIIKFEGVTRFLNFIAAATNNPTTTIYNKWNQEEWKKLVKRRMAIDGRHISKAFPELEFHCEKRDKESILSSMKYYVFECFEMLMGGWRRYKYHDKWMDFLLFMKSSRLFLLALLIPLGGTGELIYWYILTGFLIAFFKYLDLAICNQGI